MSPGPREGKLSYKDIIVYLDGSPENGNRLEFAIAVARSFGARLTGIDVDTEAALKAEWAGAAAGLQELFEQKTASAGLRHHFTVARQDTSLGPDLHSHFADLVIAMQPNTAPRGFIVPALPQDILLSAGVPMILLPPMWELPPEGATLQNLLIAWSPSREATRAVHDAMPFLQRAAAVTLFAFHPPADSETKELDSLREHLQEHGVSSAIERWPDTGELSAVEALFASRGLEAADMIIAGAYGRARVVEELFGGVTEDLLHQISMPVFLSH